MKTNKSGRHILILGAGSGMSLALLPLLFNEWQSSHFYLLARNPKALKSVADEGNRQGHTVELFPYDLEHPTDLHFAGIEYIITYAGWLPDDKTAFEKSMLLNFTGIKDFLEKQIAENSNTLKQIIITGSVAGVRFRPNNLAYGMAKGALHQYTKALQKKWAGKFATTLVIPGYVSTKMLSAMNTPAAITLSPEQMAKKYTVWLETKPKLVYSQPVWRLIALVLKLVPEFVVKRMKK